MLFTYIFQNNFLLPIILSKMTNKERHENEKKTNEITGAEIQKNVIILSISNTPVTTLDIEV